MERLRALLGSRETGIAAALVAALVVLLAFVEKFFAYGNFFNTSPNASPVGVSALGQTVMILTCGIDLSVGSVMAVSGRVTTLVQRSGGAGDERSAAGLVAALAVGLFNGLLVMSFLHTAPDRHPGHPRYCREPRACAHREATLWEVGGRGGGQVEGNDPRRPAGATMKARWSGPLARRRSATRYRRLA